MRDAYDILVGKPKERYYTRNLGVDGKITLEWILGKWTGMV
jgi:hypothetical protein